MVMELPSDLVEEILSWVPAISLVRLRYTCKQWETLIAERRFLKKHFSHMRFREHQFFVFNKDFTVSSVGIDLNKLEEPCLNIQGFEPFLLPNLSSATNMCHCDGLLLFVMEKRLLVLNPLLRQGRWIERGYRYDPFMDDVYGLGYVSNQSSSSCHDYKIVRFRRSDGDSRIEVYTFTSDSWKVVVDKTFDDFYLSLGVSSVCLRGTPYWMGCNKDGDRQALSILSFDFSKERFEPLVLPPPLIGSLSWNDAFSLGIIRGDQLSLSRLLGLRGEIHVWVKKKQHWSRLMTVAIPQVSEFFIYSSYFIENNGKLVTSFVHHRSVSIYVVGENQECLKIEHNSCSSRYIFVACFYVPSLLSVPGSSRFLC